MACTLKKLISTTTLIALTVVSALSRDAVLTFSNATNIRKEIVTIRIGGTNVHVEIPPKASASKKRDLIYMAIRKRGFVASTNGRAGSSLTISQLGAHEVVEMDMGKTGEVADAIKSTQPDSAAARFQGTFAPFDHRSQPAIFTAGIVTELGELTVQVSSAELNFQTDGPIICQALFQRLAPRAPNYGAQVNYAGDRLEVYFDPAYSVTQGGIIFGTTSPSQGCGGTLYPTPLEEIVTLRLSSSASPMPTNNAAIAYDGLPRTIQFPPFASPQQKCESVMMSGQHPNVVLLSDWTQEGTLIARFRTPMALKVATGSSMSVEETIYSCGITSSTIQFAGNFNPFSQPGVPAVFTAGIVTDVGELTAHVSAQELNFVTDGPIICQALFQRLAPQAPLHGAHIAYAGDRLEVYFDPAYSISHGTGIAFGTTSRSPGCSGEVRFESN